MKPYKETTHYYWAWEPVYEKYEDIEVDDYCESCGQRDGSHIEVRGINILRYDLKKRKKGYGFLLNRVMEKKLIDSILTGPTYLTRMLRGN